MRTEGQCDVPLCRPLAMWSTNGLRLERGAVIAIENRGPSIKARLHPWRIITPSTFQGTTADAKSRTTHTFHTPQETEKPKPLYLNPSPLVYKKN